MINDIRLSFLYDVLKSDLRRYSCTNTLMEKWKDLKAVTAFQILSVNFKQISAEKKITALLRVVRKYKFCISFTLTFRIN